MKKKALIVGAVLLLSGCSVLAERLNYGHVLQMKRDAQIVQKIMEQNHE